MVSFCRKNSTNWPCQLHIILSVICVWNPTHSKIRGQLINTMGFLNPSDFINAKRDFLKKEKLTMKLEEPAFSKYSLMRKIRWMNCVCYLNAPQACRIMHTINEDLRIKTTMFLMVCLSESVFKNWVTELWNTMRLINYEPDMFKVTEIPVITGVNPRSLRWKKKSLAWTVECQTTPPAEMAP